ncbi:MAG: phenylalanine--tRNA ligase subunit beta [Myxococcales bacterium]|nr:phenylalanine--tRNA ligase subunit beta [Myxococcales bacterium]
MRVPLSQLRRFFPDSRTTSGGPSGRRFSDIPVEELARELNARVSEVEKVHRHPGRESFADVTIVQADQPVRRVEGGEGGKSGEGYTLWQMRAGKPGTGGSEEVQTDAAFRIVVGDRFGLRAGDRVAAVLAGGTMPDGTKVVPRDVAGMASEGVLVSEAQLGVGKDATRPLIFAPDVGLHADPWEALGGAEVILEFDLEPNRPDLYSLAGVARDVGAIWGLAVCLPAGPALCSLPSLNLGIRLSTPRARHYAGAAMAGITVGPSPQWLQNAMRAFGMRPINNVVDAANLVMLELGQPLHTFDRERLAGPEIVLRMATSGETVTTLDGVRRELTDECLLVCDGDASSSRPIAIAGVMGDSGSEVHAGTSGIVIESAAFDMAAVRRASRRLSLRTEASLRFEKGLPVCGVAPAIERLAGLLRELCGAQVVALSVAGEPAPAPARIAYDRDAIRARLGMDVADDEMDRLLTATGLELGGTVELAGGGAGGRRRAFVVAPEFRPDLRIPQDLVEEVGRLHGYEHVKAEAPTLPLKAPDSTPQVRLARASRQVLSAAGFDEVYLPVWIGAEDVSRFQLDPQRLITLINPLASNLTTFRTTALPALLEACIQNRKELATFGLFEVGRVYRRTPGDPASGAIDERQHLSGIAMGRGLLEVRDVLLRLGRTLGAGLEVSRAGRPDFALADVLHPGRSLSLATVAGSGGAGGPWATVGELHPRLVRAAGLRETPVVFWVDLEGLLGVHQPPVRFVPPPRHPSVVLDVNVTIGARVESGSVLAAVPSLPTLVGAEIADVYPLEAGARVTLRLTLNAGERSLTAEEAADSVALVRAAVGRAGFSV